MFLMMIYLSVISVMAHHPLILSLLLIFYAMVSGGILGWVLSKWFFVAVILVFLGGMMVVFFYATSLSTMDKLYAPSVSAMGWVVLAAAMLKASGWGLELSLNLNPLSSVLQIYTGISFKLVIFLMSLLLLTLFFVVKICSFFKGSLTRQF